MRSVAVLTGLAVALAAWAALGSAQTRVTAAISESEVPLDARRGVEQTLLTYPEWFLVHSPREYATLVSHRPSHEFPFIGHIGQLWSSYAAVTSEQVRAGYPMNVGYHVMIGVIAASTTVEYAIRWAYENAVARISWGLSTGKLTAEDVYAAKVAQDYVDFIQQKPWYLYDFTSKLVGLWRETPVVGRNGLRKWERRYALTTEYAIKALYGKLIEVATRSAYAPALMTTEVVVDHVPQVTPTTLNITVLKPLPGDRALLRLPRYFDFRIAATELARQGVRLVDIAGNTSVILVTVWADDQSKIDSKRDRVLFEQALLTLPGMRRVGLLVPVSGLSDFLVTAPQNGLKVEHVYDY